MYNIVGYARVSTQEQADDSNALKQQVALLQQHGADIVISEVISRMSDSRTGLDYIFQLIETKQMKVLLIKDLSRLTGMSGLFENLTDRLRANGIELRGIYDTIDIYSTMGQTMSAIQVVINKAEVLRIRERIKRGLQYRREKHYPNSIAPFGYKIVDNKYVLSNEMFLSLIATKTTYSKADVARWIVKQFFIQGSVSKTLDILHSTFGLYRFKYVDTTKKNNSCMIHNGDKTDSINKFSSNKKRRTHCKSLYFDRSSLIYWLVNPVLCGHTRYIHCKNTRKIERHNHQIIYNTHPTETILTDEQQEDIIKTILLSNPSSGWDSYHKKRHIVRYLTGLLVCESCHNNMVIKCNNPDKVRYYGCSNKECTNRGRGKFIREDKISEYIIEQLRYRAIDIANSLDNSNVLSDNSQLIELELQLKGLNKLPYNPAIEMAKAEITKQIDDMRSSISSIYQQYNVNKTILLESLEDKDYWYSLSNEDRAVIYKLLIDKIIVYNMVDKDVSNRLTIVWNI